MSRRRNIDEIGTATPQRSRVRRLWEGWVRPIGVILVVLCSFRSAVADWNDVPTQSMEPTILVGDRILVNKLAWDLKVPFTTWHLAEWGDPARGEIVVFYAPHDGRRMVKRVIGVQGDRVAMQGNRLAINGRPVDLRPATAVELGADDLTDPPPHRFAVETLGGAAHAVMAQPGRRAPRSFAPLTVPPGRYLLMGDNRDNSGDSRVFGFVPRRAIVGRAHGVAVSFDRDDGWRPRWRRFFRGLGGRGP